MGITNRYADLLVADLEPDQHSPPPSPPSYCLLFNCSVANAELLPFHPPDPRPDTPKRELKQTAKRLEKAESFASDLEAEVKRVAGDGVNFETFVVLKRDNHALKTQLAELKQAREGGGHSGRGYAAS